MDEKTLVLDLFKRILRMEPSCLFFKYHSDDFHMNDDLSAVNSRYDAFEVKVKACSKLIISDQITETSDRPYLNLAVFMKEKDVSKSLFRPAVFADEKVYLKTNLSLPFKLEGGDDMIKALVILRQLYSFYAERQVEIVAEVWTNSLDSDWILAVTLLSIDYPLSRVILRTSSMMFAPAFLNRKSQQQLVYQFLFEKGRKNMTYLYPCCTLQVLNVVDWDIENKSASDIFAWTEEALQRTQGRFYSSFARSDAKIYASPRVLSQWGVVNRHVAYILDDGGKEIQTYGDEYKITGAPVSLRGLDPDNIIYGSAGHRRLMACIKYSSILSGKNRLKENEWNDYVCLLNTVMDLPFHFRDRQLGLRQVIRPVKKDYQWVGESVVSEDINPSAIFIRRNKRKHTRDATKPFLFTLPFPVTSLDKSTLLFPVCWMGPYEDESDICFTTILTRDDNFHDSRYADLDDDFFDRRKHTTKYKNPSSTYDRYIEEDIETKKQDTSVTKERADESPHKSLIEPPEFELFEYYEEEEDDTFEDTFEHDIQERIQALKSQKKPEQEDESSEDTFVDASEGESDKDSSEDTQDDDTSSNDSYKSADSPGFFGELFMKFQHFKNEIHRQSRQQANMKASSRGEYETRDKDISLGDIVGDSLFCYGQRILFIQIPLEVFDKDEEKSALAVAFLSVRDAFPQYEPVTNAESVMIATRHLEGLDVGSYIENRTKSMQKELTGIRIHGKDATRVTTDSFTSRCVYKRVPRGTYFRHYLNHIGMFQFEGRMSKPDLGLQTEDKLTLQKKVSKSASGFDTVPFLILDMIVRDWKRHKRVFECLEVFYEVLSQLDWHFPVGEGMKVEMDMTTIWIYFPTKKDADMYKKVVEGRLKTRSDYIFVGRRGVSISIPNTYAIKLAYESDE